MTYPLEFIQTARSGIYINERTQLPDGTFHVRLFAVLWI